MPAPLHHDPIPFITLPNWVKAATVCGFNIEPIFARLGVQTDLLHLEEATISAPLLGQAMDACVAASRSQHFPFVLGETFAFDYLPDIGTFLATAPTLRAAVRVFDWVRELINPMIDIRIEESGDVAALTLAGPGAAADQDRYFVESLFAAVVKFGRMLAADVEAHASLQFRHAAPEYAQAYETYFRLPVRFGQPRNALQIPRARLDAALEGGFAKLHAQALARVEQRLAELPRHTGLIAMLEAALEAQPALLGRGIGAVAACVSLQPRTLQRRLREERETYAGVVDRVRYRLALRALQSPDADLEALSEQLGFSDRRSFTRAFTRWSGVTPSSFRQRREL